LQKFVLTWTGNFAQANSKIDNTVVAIL